MESRSHGEILRNDAEVNPSVDAIGEFKLVTNNYSAEYTHALSGVTSFTMKSGTNALHGSAFEFDDNDKFDARGFFPATRLHRKQNELGFTARRPADSDSESLQRHRTAPFGFLLRPVLIRGGQLAGLNTLPTARMLHGDFSESAGPDLTIRVPPPWIPRTEESREPRSRITQFRIARSVRFPPKYFLSIPFRNCRG